MKDKLSESQTASVLQALEEAISEGPWQESAFLKVIGKNLEKIRERVLDELPKENKKTNEMLREEMTSSEWQEVYILLYCSEGSRIASWEKILENLEGQMISRPVYGLEEDIADFIKSRENKLSDAYVAALVRKNDILQIPIEKTAQDRFGKPLLVLKDKAVSLQKIRRFVHPSGTYQYRKGNLIRA